MAISSVTTVRVNHGTASISHGPNVPTNNVQGEIVPL